MARPHRMAHKFVQDLGPEATKMVKGGSIAQLDVSCKVMRHTCTPDNMW